MLLLKLFISHTCILVPNFPLNMATGHLGYVVGMLFLLLYYLYAKIGMCGLRIYCMLHFKVMTTGHLGIYYVLRLFDFLWGMWHDFSILNWLVQLKRVRNRRKDTLILQGESRNVRNCLKCLYSQLSKVVEIWTSFAKALVSYFTWPDKLF